MSSLLIPTHPSVYRYRTLLGKEILSFFVGSMHQYVSTHTSQHWWWLLIFIGPLDLFLYRGCNPSIFNGLDRINGTWIVN